MRICTERAAPVIYDIKLALGYDYAGSAGAGRHLVRVLPLEVPGQQRLVAGEVRIDPAPEERRDRRDFFGNHLVEFSFRAAHDSLDLVMLARIIRQASALTEDRSTGFAMLARDLAACRDLGPGSPLHMVAASPRVVPDAPTAVFARDLLQPGQTSREVVQAVGRALHDHMTFDPDATEVDTPLAEAFASRKGVCQDYSHILIACLRGVGVPAGYVSGFLRTEPPPGKSRLEGADAMHAWVRAWCGAQVGWVEYDPTNACMVGCDHIVVAYGRDYSDVAPIKGILRVSGRQNGRQAVDVMPLAD